VDAAVVLLTVPLVSGVLGVSIAATAVNGAEKESILKPSFIVTPASRSVSKESTNDLKQSIGTELQTLLEKIGYLQEEMGRMLIGLGQFIGRIRIRVVELAEDEPRGSSARPQ